MWLMIWNVIKEDCDFMKSALIKCGRTVPQNKYTAIS